jgi:hypothetical protein
MQLIHLIRNVSCRDVTFNPSVLTFKTVGNKYHICQQLVICMPSVIGIFHLYHDTQDYTNTLANINVNNKQSLPLALCKLTTH